MIAIKYKPRRLTSAYVSSPRPHLPNSSSLVSRYYLIFFSFTDSVYCRTNAQASPCLPACRIATDLFRLSPPSLFKLHDQTAPSPHTTFPGHIPCPTTAIYTRVSIHKKRSPLRRDDVRIKWAVI